MFGKSFETTTLRWHFYQLENRFARLLLHRYFFRIRHKINLLTYSSNQQTCVITSLSALQLMSLSGNRNRLSLGSETFLSLTWENQWWAINNFNNNEYLQSNFKHRLTEAIQKQNSQFKSYMNFFISSLTINNDIIMIVNIWINELKIR